MTRNSGGVAAHLFASSHRRRLRPQNIPQPASQSAVHPVDIPERDVPSNSSPLQSPIVVRRPLSPSLPPIPFASIPFDDSPSPSRPNLNPPHHSCSPRVRTAPVVPPVCIQLSSLDEIPEPHSPPPSHAEPSSTGLDPPPYRKLHPSQLSPSLHPPVSPPVAPPSHPSPMLPPTAFASNLDADTPSPSRYNLDPPHSSCPPRARTDLVVESATNSPTSAMNKINNPHSSSSSHAVPASHGIPPLPKFKLNPPHPHPSISPPFPSSVHPLHHDSAPKLPDFGVDPKQLATLSFADLLVIFPPMRAKVAAFIRHLDSKSVSKPICDPPSVPVAPSPTSFIH
ncbi:hypothetical protein K438DRAFT_2025274 [Mycena galopus ATCC 62051]|nr:hypothetical protein K438DRAFT_2025274 [Mycena galopus ATCC 62051]